jgi:H+/Cl- antiporter ClcA
MKALSHILLFLGSAVLLIGILRIFQCFKAYIVTDKQFVLIYAIGMFLAVMGMLLNSLAERPVHWQQKQKRRDSIHAGIGAAIASTVLLIFSLCL